MFIERSTIFWTPINLPRHQSSTLNLFSPMPFITFCAKVRPHVDATHRTLRGHGRTVAALAIYESIHLPIYVPICVYIYIYQLIDIFIHLCIYLYVCLSTDPSVGCFYDGLNKLSDHSFVNNNFFAEFIYIAKGDTKKRET